MATNAMTGDGNGMMVPVNQSQAPSTNAEKQSSLGSQAGTFSDQQLLDMFKRWKKESFDQRWIFERQFMRNIWYLLNRQWIYYDSKRGQWQDKRLAKWIPRPVTNILKEALQSVRSNFAGIDYGAMARPMGDDNEAVVCASVADDYLPILHAEHKMDSVMNEFDFWLLGTGNAWLHTGVNYERQNGTIRATYETCLTCQTTTREDYIAESKQKCPKCGGTQFQPATLPDGSPLTEDVPLPKGLTIPLSFFEVAYPLMYERYELAPYTIRMRWRDKSYYEQNEEMQQYVSKLGFSKTPQERTMQIFKTLPFQGDIGITPPYFASGGANVDSEGVVEYDIWVKPCADFPDGQVIRIAGDSNPTVIHSEKEGLPGPLPYHDGEGNPLFTFHHARYEQVGGRSLGSSLIDPGVQKQDQLNQLDAHMLMIIGRMANPIWLEPKGAEVEKFTGEPGLVVKWNPLVAGGNAKPERIPGEGINESVFQYRELIKQEAQELMGTFDVLAGQRPPNTSAYASMEFLLQRAQGRHASAYKERGAVYRGWAGDALEIEREFGPAERTRWVMSPSRAWSLESFKKTSLAGNVEIIIEDGTMTPKSALGERAAIDHLAELGLLDPNDPDQKIAIFQKFGQTKLTPGIDAQVQEAWMNMDKFEKFLSNPAAVQQAQQEAQQNAIKAQATGEPMQPAGPLVYRRWYNPQIHRNELIKWCLSDRGRAVFSAHPAALQYIDGYLSQIDLAIAQLQMGIIDSAGIPIQTQPQQPGGPGVPGPQTPPQNLPQNQGAHGARQAPGNSDQNAGGVGKSTSGAGRMQEPPAVQEARTARAMAYLGKS